MFKNRTSARFLSDAGFWDDQPMTEADSKNDNGFRSPKKDGSDSVAQTEPEDQQEAND